MGIFFSFEVISLARQKTSFYHGNEKEIKNAFPSFSIVKPKISKTFFSLFIKMTKYQILDMKTRFLWHNSLFNIESNILNFKSQI
jgi:hypothetical protein